MIGLDGSVVDVEWDRGRFPYLIEVHWSAAGIIVSTESRSQREGEVLDVDTASGATELRFADLSLMIDLACLAQRLRAQQLMGVALRFPAFPITLETYREVLRDVFDLPALVDVLHKLRSREVQVTMREREHGRSSITFVRSVYYMLKVTLALLVAMARKPTLPDEAPR